MATPLRVACALIERGGRILVAQRPPGKSLALKWEFPGGKLEPGESGREALAREIIEELGVHITVGRELPAVVHHYDGFSITLLPYLCLIESGHIQPREHVAVRWCATEEIEGLDLAAADRPVLELYRALRRHSGPTSGSDGSRQG